MGLKACVRLLHTTFFLSALASSGVAAQIQCPSTGVAVQILGSGGPLAGTGRASSSYVVWVDGRSRVMVDAGGGSFLRVGESGTQLADLDLLALSHFHPDHVSDLPATLWLSDRLRQEPLRIAGPSGNEAVPPLDLFLSRLFDRENGAFQLLSGTLGGPGRGVLLDPVMVDVDRGGPVRILQKAGVTVRALPVPHANIPSLAYRVEAQGVSVVFSGDQTGRDPAFVSFSRGASALVMHMAVSPTASGGTLDFHATPGVVGQIAADAGVEQLILSHLFVGDLEEGVAEVRTRYPGVVRVGEDLACYPVG